MRCLLAAVLSVRVFRTNRGGRELARPEIATPKGWEINMGIDFGLGSLGTPFAGLLDRYEWCPDRSRRNDQAAWLPCGTEVENQ